MKCPTCGHGILTAIRRPVDYEGVRLGIFTVSVCSSCGAEVIDATNSRLIDDAFERAWTQGTLAPPAGWKAAARETRPGTATASRVRAKRPSRE